MTSSDSIKRICALFKDAYRPLGSAYDIVHIPDFASSLSWNATDVHNNIWRRYPQVGIDGDITPVLTPS